MLPDVYKQLRENRDTLRVKVSGILKSMCESSSIKLDLEQKMHDLRSPTLIRDLLLQKAQLTTNRLEIEQISTPYHNTQCLTCSVTCHENCQLSFTPQPGHDIFEGCACMNDGKCSGCTHDYKTHAHINFIYKRKIVSEPLITDAELEELKSLETTVAMQKFILDKHQMKLTVGNHQAQQLTQDLRNALRELNALCPYYDYRMELKCALELLKEAKRVNTGRYDREEVERLEEHFRRLLVDFNQAEAYQP